MIKINGALKTTIALNNVTCIPICLYRKRKTNLALSSSDVKMLSRQNALPRYFLVLALGNNNIDRVNVRKPRVALSIHNPFHQINLLYIHTRTEGF